MGGMWVWDEEYISFIWVSNKVFVVLKFVDDEYVGAKLTHGRVFRIPSFLAADFPVATVGWIIMIISVCLHFFHNRFNSIFPLELININF